MGSVQTLYCHDDIMICKETASELECLAYAHTAPNIVQISAFLISKDWLLKCVGLNFESADFQKSPSDIEINLNIPLAILKF